MPEDQPPPIIPQPDSNPSNEAQAKTWNMLCHLSTLAGLIIPFGNIIGPLLVWQLKKHEFPSVEHHGKAALNFQLTVLICAIAAGIACFCLSFFCVGYLLIPVIFLIGVAGIIFPVIAGIKANNGEAYNYPFNFDLIK